MSGGKIISRSSLYDSDEVETNDEEEYQMPYQMDFEFVTVESGDENDKVEVDNVTEPVGGEEESNNQEDEFEFPLFSIAVTDKGKEVSQAKEESKKHEEEGEERGRSKSKVMKISLREESLEVVRNERPQSYYVSNYSQEEKNQFLQVAVTGADIYAQLTVSAPFSEPKPWRVINLNEFNDSIEQDLLKQKIRSKNRREGKKKRVSKIACRERKLERLKLQKKLEKEEKARLKKKLFHKRGGKKNRKSSATSTSNSNGKSAVAKPKYRTE